LSVLTSDCLSAGLRVACLGEEEFCFPASLHGGGGKPTDALTRLHRSMPLFQLTSTDLAKLVALTQTSSAPSTGCNPVSKPGVPFHERALGSRDTVLASHHPAIRATPEPGSI
jgi:hypothetical protein